MGRLSGDLPILLIGDFDLGETEPPPEYLELLLSLDLSRLETLAPAPASFLFISTKFGSRRAG